MIKRGGLYFLLLFSLHSLISGCVSSEIINHERNIDPNSFIGEKILFRRASSSQIKNLKLNISFPVECSLLSEANPSIRLFTQKRFVKSFTIVGAVSTFVLDESIDEDLLFAELSLFYCKEGDQGLCILKSVLFEIMIDDQLPAGDLDLEYIVGKIEG